MNSLIRTHVLTALTLAAAAVLIGAQTLQRPKTFDPKVLTSSKLVQPKLPNSMMNMRLPEPIPLEPNWQDKHEPLTLHVADSIPGRGTAIAVTKADGAGFFTLGEPNVIQVYSPYYKLKRVDRNLDDSIFVFGNDTVECKVFANPNGSLFRLTLACQRSDPDIPATSNFEQRPFFVVVSRKDPASGMVQRGATMVTLNGYVAEKP